MSDLDAIKAFEERLRPACARNRHRHRSRQDKVVEEILIAIFARGHCLLEASPALAKTFLISSLARCLEPVVQTHPVHAGLDAQRHHRTKSFRTTKPRRAHVPFIKGPVFANIVLADKSTAPRLRRRPR